MGPGPGRDHGASSGLKGCVRVNRGRCIAYKWSRGRGKGHGMACAKAQRQVRTEAVSSATGHLLTGVGLGGRPATTQQTLSKAREMTEWKQSTNKTLLLRSLHGEAKTRTNNNPNTVLRERGQEVP